LLLTKPPDRKKRKPRGQLRQPEKQKKNAVASTKREGGADRRRKPKGEEREDVI